jgi:hypothetical protein
MQRVEGDVVKDKKKWIFHDGEGSMVGSCEEMIKFEWTTSIWGLLEWQVEMQFNKSKTMAWHFHYYFLFSHLEKYNKQESN